MAFVRVLNVADLAPGVGKLVDVGGKKIALFLVDGKTYAIDDTCPHRGAPMHEGTCFGTEVECPWHAARFDLTTGKHLCPPAKSSLKAYPSRIEGDAVEIDV